MSSPTSSTTTYSSLPTTTRNLIPGKSMLAKALTNAKLKGRLKSKKQKKLLPPSKAREMLHDGTAHGKPLTDKQRRWLGWQINK